MQRSKKLLALLALSGLLATTIGGALLFTPQAFHGANGIELAADPNLLSEVRAPGGLLLLAGLVMLAGLAQRQLARPATAIGAGVFLAYGTARLIAIGIDGVPGTGLLLATAIELALGIACGLTWQRLRRSVETSGNLEVAR
ncbi:MAG: DUF4345 domain-containing protein [bacterium]|nr:DUF4345 domain-containing protein [bacterium]